MANTIDTIESDYVSTREAAAQLGVAVRTIQLWVESSVLPAWKTAGGHRRIPRSAVDDLLAARRSTLTPASSAADAAAELRILVVEDDPALQLLFEMTLGSWGLPLTVDLADNGFSALLKMGERAPDLLITDLNMPGMDGFSMIRHLRQTPAWHTLPIIVVSALGQRDIEQRGGLPADIPVFDKPVPFDRLEALIRERLADRARPAAQQA